MVGGLRGSPSNDEARALLVLSELPGVGLRRLRRLTDRFGSARGVLRARPVELKGSLPEKALAALGDGSAAERVDQGLASARSGGMEWIAWDDDDYPPRLLRLADPPPVLFLRGQHALLRTPGVAVVGARRATARARDVARLLGARLGAEGFPVVSGMALGVDGAAHRGALQARGPTIAVVATGADRAYPPSHSALYRDVIRDGLLVSEFLPNTPPLPHHFPRRNRVLAALAHTVVVVEAGARSGALITVDHALDLGLDVWAVPGPIDNTGCAGSNAMLSDGARPLVSVADFVRRLGEAGRERVSPLAGGDTAAEGEASGSDPRGASLPPGSPERAVLAAFGSEPAGVDDLALSTGLPTQELVSILTALELVGRVERRPGPSFQRVG